MSIRPVFYVILSLTLLLNFCSSEKVESVSTDTEKTHIGGAILISPLGEVPSNLYMNSGVVPTDEYKPFTKKLTVYGITLIGRDDISDAFMQKVAQTITEMFPQGGAIDGALQKEVIRNMYTYRALIPLVQHETFNGFRDMSPEDKVAWGFTKSQNSVCDTIHEDPPVGQVHEVVEHILHYANDIGLHYTFPDEWGISKTSKLYQFLLEAVKKEYYDESMYERFEDEEIRLRIKLQEFGYKFISTAWDLNRPHDKGGYNWAIRNSDELRKMMPQMYQVYEQTVMKVMVSPSRSLLDELFGIIEIY